MLSQDIVWWLVLVEIWLRSGYLTSKMVKIPENTFIIFASLSATVQREKNT
jgi:hypothetical protein